MQESISLQPHVRKVRVSINQKMLMENVFGYSELEGRMITAEVEINYEGVVARARLEYDKQKNYPLMSLL
jgi:dihydroneopterin aldolase